MEKRPEVQALGVAIGLFTLAMVGRSLTTKSKSEGSNPPPQYSPGLPFVGGFMQFVQDPLECVRNARKVCGDVFTIRLLTEQVTVLLGPVPHAAFFNATDEELDQADPYKFMTPIFGKDVLYDVPLEKRRQQVRALATILKPANLRMYPEMIAAETKRYLEKKWSGQEGTCDIHEMFADLIIQTGSATLMGHEIQHELFDEMFRYYSDLDKGLTPLSVIFPYAPTESHRKRDIARKAIGELFSRIIQKRKEDPEKSSHNSDVVQRLMEFRYPDGTGLSDDQIAGMMVATLFAAQHTSNVTATWTTLFLLDNLRNGGDYLQKALDEMKQLEPEPNMFREGKGVTYKTIMDQTWLYSCIKEAIRVHPPLIFLLRRALQDIPVTKDIHVPKGNLVMVSNAIAQRLPEVFERPDEYLPERWATWDITTLPKYSFIGFGAGIHTCMGESFAFLQVRTILNVLFSMYELELTTPFPTPDYECIVVMPHGPNIVKWKRKQPADPTSYPVKNKSAVVTAPTEQKPVTVTSDDVNTKYTRAQVASHTTKGDLWIIVRGKVYDISTYVDIHQGGEQALFRVAGKDATEQVEGPQHPGTVPTLLQRFQIGILSD